MRGDAIISALIGLAGACGSNPKTPDTDGILLRALAVSPDDLADGPADAEEELVGAIHAEKYRIAPGCAVCANPCGSTSDYEMRRLEQAEEGVRRAKRQLIERLRALAAGVLRCQDAGAAPPVGPDFFYRALTYLGCDLEETILRGLLQEAEVPETLETTVRFCGKGEEKE